MHEPKSRSSGFSLIELLVSLVIGLVLTLAISSVLIKTESAKRSTTAVNDVDQSGVYATYVLDRVIRSAGSGYAQRWREAFGCPLVAARSGAALSFLSSRWVTPSPAQTLALAPVLIGKDQANSASGDVRGDLITVMAGTAGYSETPQSVVSTYGGASPQINVNNTLGYKTGDMVLMFDQSVPAGCMIEQIGAPILVNTGALPISGTYFLASGTSPRGTVSVTSFGTGSYVSQLGSGNAAKNNAPEFLTFGVTDNHVLSSFDLLNIDGTGATADMAEGVVEMRALYGIDTVNAPTGSVQQWVDPGGSGYDIATLLGSGQQSKLRNIIAVRIGLILRTSNREKDPVAQPGSVILFGDLGAGLQKTRALAAEDLHYRYRTLDLSIPLRNVVLAP